MNLAFLSGARGATCAALVCAVVVACSSGGDTVDKTAPSGRAVAVSPTVFDETPSGAGGVEGESDDPIGTTEGAPSLAEAEAFDDKTSDAYQIFVDPPRTSSAYCGDGAHDPETEECDDGLAPGEGADASRSVCTSNCQTRDLLAVEEHFGGDEESRHVGFGRHPMAGTRGGDLAEGAGVLAWVEQGNPRLSDGEVGSAPQVVAQLLDAHGNPTQRVVVAEAATESADDGTPTSTSNPVSAVLPDGSVVVAYEDLNGDGNELGVGLRRLTRADEGWALSSLRFANETTIGAPSTIPTWSGPAASW